MYKNFKIDFEKFGIKVKQFNNPTKGVIKEKFEDFYEWLKKENKNNPEFNKHPYGIERLKAMVDFVYSEDWSSLMPAFKEYIIKMDKIRGTDFSKTFPEMKELIK